MEERLEQSENVSEPIDVTESGITILRRDVHPENVFEPIDVTEYGITML